MEAHRVMNTKKRTQPNTLNAVLRDARVRKRETEQGTLYVAADLVAVLTDSTHAAEHWADLKAHESALDQAAISIDIDGQQLDVLPLDGVLRLVQSLTSTKAERIKLWIADAAQ